MITTFQLDSKKAKEVGNESYINASGAYLGHFQNVRIYQSASQAQMVDFEFVANSGEKGKFSLCTYAKDGKEAFGLNILHAVMTVFRLRSLQAVEGIYKKNGVEERGFLLKELMNKPVGVLLQLTPEEYPVRDHMGQVVEVKISNKLSLLTPFDPNTWQNAAEILNNAEAKAVKTRLETLKDKTLKKFAGSSQGGYSADPYANQYPHDYQQGYQQPQAVQQQQQYQPGVQQPSQQQYQQQPQYQQPGVQQPVQQSVQQQYPQAGMQYMPEEDIPF